MYRNIPIPALYFHLSVHILASLPEDPSKTTCHLKSWLCLPCCAAVSSFKHSQHPSVLTISMDVKRRYLVCHSVRPSISYHVFSHYVQQGGCKGTPMDSIVPRQNFKSIVFKSNKSKKANMLLPHLDRSLPICTQCKHQKLVKG